MKRKLFLIIATHSSEKIILPTLDKLKQEYDIVGVFGPNIEKKLNKQSVINGALLSNIDIMSILFKLHRYIHIVNYIIKCIISEKPDIVITVDQFTIMNIIVKKSKKQHIKKKLNNPIYMQYIAPTVWLWGRDRAKKLQKNFNALASIFNMDTPYFQSSNNFKFEFIGHPIYEDIEGFKKQLPSISLDIDFNEKYLLLMPGSRKHEIKYMLKFMLQIIKQCHDKDVIKDYKIYIPVAQEYKDYINKIIHKSKVKAYAVSTTDPNVYYHLLNNANFVLSKAGTNNLEVGLFNIPIVVLYRTSIISELILKYILRYSINTYISLINIILNKKVIDEYYGYFGNSKGVIIKPCNISDIVDNIKKCTTHNKCYNYDINTKLVPQVYNGNLPSRNLYNFIKELLEK